MGFFLTADEAKRVEERTKRGTPRVKNEVIYDPNRRGCDHCPLKNTWQTLTSPCMQMHGPRDADILVLGEAPGETEDLQGRPFVGKAGKFLKGVIPSRHIDRLAWSNACRCRPPGNRNPTAQEVHACSIYLEQDVAERKFKAVLIVGSIPLSKWIDETSLTNIIGTRFPIEIGDISLWGFPVLHPSFVMRSGEDRAPQYPVFQADIKRFFKFVDRWKSPTVYKPKPEDVICVYTEEEAKELLARCKGELGVDIETSSLRSYERGARWLSAAISDGETTFSFPVDHPDAPNDWGMHFILKVMATRAWIAHNAAFELQWALFWGRKLYGKYEPMRFEDSMAHGRIFHSRETLLSLAVLSRIILGVNVKKLTNVNAADMMAYSLSEILPYNGIDAWACKMLRVKMKDKVDEYNYEHILATIRSTTEMELAGLPVDFEIAAQFEQEWKDIAEGARARSKLIYEVKMFERERQQEFKISAPDDVGVALVDYGKLVLPKTPSGKSYSTDDSILQPLSEQSPLIKEVLAFREAEKHRSTYVQPILDIPKLYDDLMLHPSYTAMLTATLRLSSKFPNIQNFPKRRHRSLRRMVRARPGHIFIACDMGQLEARVYAMLTKDKMLCESIIDKEDIHTYWLDRALDIYPDYLDRLADKTNETDEKKIRKGGRDIIKSDFVFATFFGSNAQSCADRTGIPLALTNDLVDDFWTRYKGARDWVKGQRILYRETGEVQTLTGRKRYGVLSGNEPLNTPIQGSAADLVIDAQNDLSRMALETNDFYLHPRINIHDDLEFEIPDQDDQIEAYINEITKTMVKVRFPWQIVPLSVEVKIGYNWADLDEVTVFIGDHVR